MVRNSARFWKVRPMPAAAMRCRGTASKGWPSNTISPLSQRESRERQLNSVVLPAPFGPIKLAI